MIYQDQKTAEWVSPFPKDIFSRNFAYAKFCENKTVAKISEFTVG